MNRTALLFPGQGSQYVGMGKMLYERYAAAKQTFEEANEALAFDIAALCFEGGIEELTKTEHTQPALLTVSVAAFRVYMQEVAVAPAFMAGHSLGEISALTCAGAIRFADALTIVRQRGRYMQEAVSAGAGAMAAVDGLAREIVEEECRNARDEGLDAVVSNYNAPAQNVISGHAQAVAKVGSALSRQGGTVIPLKVSAPFHSPLMHSAAVKLEATLRQFSYKPIHTPVISNVDALPYKDEQEIVQRLTRQMTEPVRWADSMSFLQQQGVTAAVEIGAGSVLTNLMKRNGTSIRAISFDKTEDLSTLRNELEVNGNHSGKQGELPAAARSGTNNVVTKCLTIAVCTRNRNWNNDEYEKGVIEPYRTVQLIQDELDRSGRQPTLGEMQDALKMLGSVFETKKVPIEERKDRFNQVLDETKIRDILTPLIKALLP